MSNATEQERQAVTAAIREACAPYHEKHADAAALASMRTAIFHALYALACKRVIPPELKLDVEVRANVDGSIAVDLPDDLRTWLRVPR